MKYHDTTNPREAPSPERLIAAADAILLAESMAGKGTVTMWRDESRPSRDGFSSHELVEAMMFLRRLGLTDLEIGAARPRRPGM